MTLTTPRLRDPHRRRVLLATLVVGALTLTLSTACAKQTGGADATKTPANQGLNAIDPSSSASDDGTSDDNGGSSSSPAPSAKPSAKPSSNNGGNGAKIVVFKATQLPQCAIVGTVDAPYSQPAKDIILTWQVTGATGVDLYLNDGLYSRYGATGSQELVFVCNDKPKSTNVYKLVTSGGSGQPVTKTLTISASNDSP